MSALFAGGWILNWILLGMVAEAGVVWAAQRFGAGGAARGKLLPTIGSGCFVMLAMRLGMGGAWWGFIAAALLGGLVLHVADIAGRWR
jgi:hypothetical protein